MLLALAFGTAAHAHYPHDVAHWAAVSPDPSEPRWATSLERINLDLLGRSDDGRSWAARLVPSATGEGGVHSGAFLTATRLVLATPEGGLLVSEDAGDTLTREPSISDSELARVVASPGVLEDGLAFAAGETAVWRTDDAGLSWEPVLDAVDAGFSDVDLSPDFVTDGRICALEGEGLACSTDHGEHWSWSAAPADSFRISVGAEERLWAAVRGAGLFASPDMGSSWFLADFEGQDVTTVAELGDGLVLLALGTEAAWRSTDGGIDWETVEIVEIPFDQSADGVNFFDFFEGPDGAVYSTNWFGLARSDDGGETYSFYDTEPIRNTHSVALTVGDDDELLAWIGTYGGGPVLVDVHTGVATDFPGLKGRFTRDTTTTNHWARDGFAIFDEGYDTYLSLDHGVTWEALAEVSHEGLETLDNDVKGVAIAPNASDDPYLLLSVGQGAMSFVSSEDLGESWTVGAQDPPCEQMGLAAAVSPRWPDGSRAWATCHGAVYETGDRGSSWSIIGDTRAFVYELVEQADGALLVATRDGLWCMDDGSTERIAFEGELVMSVAVSIDAGDDTVFALVPTLGWMRSDDGAETWVSLPAPTADFPRMIVMSPRFAEDGTVAVAGYGGAWASSNRGDSWFSIHALEIYESDHDAWKTTGDWVTERWPDASGQRVVVTRQAGASRTLEVQGAELTLTAPLDADQGIVTVALDGGPAERVELPVAAGVVWRADGLSEGWHSVRVEAVSGTVTLDSLRVAVIPGADASSDDADPRGCSCRDRDGDSGSAAFLLLPSLLLLRRRRRWLAPLSLGLALALCPMGDAWAHVPHDTVVAVAAPPEMDASAPWYLVADPYDLSLLLRSDDAGQDWYHLGGDPVGDDLLGVAVLDDGTLALLAPTRLWWLEDGVALWDELPAELSTLVPDGDRLLISGGGGLWSWSPAEGFMEERVQSSFVLLGEGPVAVDQDRDVWFLSDGAWVAAPAPAEPGAVVGADTIYLADLDGRVWRLEDEGWSACAALPQPDGDLSSEIRRLAWDGDRLVAAPGWKGPFSSDDGCASWQDRAVPGVPGAENFGQARTAAAVWRTLSAWGDRWIIGGYYGVWLSDDAGKSWLEQPILSPAATRGLAFSSVYTDDRAVYWGTYAAGVAINQDDGASFVAPSHGLAEGNVQDIRTSDNGQNHVITVVSGHVPYVSRDGGRSWNRFDSLEGQVARIFPWDGGREYWVIPYELNSPMLESLDGGQSWTTPEALIEALDGAQPASAARCQGNCDGTWRCLTAVNPTSLLCSTDGGESWEVWYRGDPGDPGSDEGRDAVTEPVLMPRDQPEVVIFGDPSGLHRVSDHGDTWVNTPIADGDVPVELACAAGDHAFAATRSGVLLRSDDRGQSWLSLEPRLSSQATVMVSSPGFVDEAHLLIANLDGVWELVDPAGDASLRRWTPWQRVDNNSGFFEKQDCPAPSVDSEASMNSRQPIPRGCTMTTNLQGETIRVLGASGQDGAAQLWIDGALRASVPDAERTNPEVLGLVGGLAPGWHRIELVGSGDASLEIDAVESTDAGDFLEPDGPGARCSCGHGPRGGVTAVLALALGLVLALRRRLSPARSRTRSGRPS